MTSEDKKMGKAENSGHEPDFTRTIHKHQDNSLFQF